MKIVISSLKLDVELKTKSNVKIDSSQLYCNFE